MPSFSARLIDFNDIKPAGARLDECAGGIGIDHNGRVYFAAQDDRDPQDVAIFRYDTKTGNRELLATVREVAARCGNLGPNQHWPREESIAKIHVSFLEHEGKMYFATHNFADPTQAYRNIYDDLPLHRGAHIFAFDIEAGTFEDVTMNAASGVAIANQSICALTIMPNQNKIVAFSFPKGDIVVHDLNTKVTNCFTGAKEYREDRSVNVGREVIATKQGGIYFSYAREKFHLRELDLSTGEIGKTRLPNLLDTGYLSGMASRKDGSVIYLIDLGGTLYAFDAVEERIRNLGNLLTDDDWKRGTRVTTVHGLALSPDETTLYSMPSRVNSEHKLVRAGMKLLTRASPGLKVSLARWRLSLLERWSRSKTLAPSAESAGRMSPDDEARGGTEPRGAGFAFCSKLYTFDIATGEKRVAGRFANIPMGAWVSGNGVIDNEGRIYYCYHTQNRNGARLLQLTPDAASAAAAGTSSSFL